MTNCTTKLSNYPYLSGCSQTQFTIPILYNDGSGFKNYNITYNDLLCRIDLSGDTYITSSVLSGTTLILYRNDGVNLYTDLSSLKGGASFTGNTSGSCISELFVSNVYGCSPVTFHTQIQYNTSSATTEYSTALGYQTTASGGYGAHAEGLVTTASGVAAHAEGNSTIASGPTSHAEGRTTTASGYRSHAEGGFSTSSKIHSHTEGHGTIAGLAYRNGTYTDGNQTIEFTGDLSSNFTSGDTLTIYYSYDYDIITSNAVISGITYSTGNTTTILLVTALGDDYSVTVVNNTTSLAITEDASHAEGLHTISSGQYSHSEGFETTASGDVSHAEGTSIASGGVSHAEGHHSIASGEMSHAEGAECIASGSKSHSEGARTTASGYYSHAEGYQTTASGQSSHAEGNGTTASGYYSHAEGGGTITFGEYSHAEGFENYAGWKGFDAVSVVNGLITISGKGDLSGEFSIWDPIVLKKDDYTNIYGFTLAPIYSAGTFTIQLTDTSINNDGCSVASFTNLNSSNPFAGVAQDSGRSGHVEGNSNKALGGVSHAEGKETKALGPMSHSEGSGTMAIGACSHAEGDNTTASGNYSHAEGANTTASGYASHAEGNKTTSAKSRSHAEGWSSIAGLAYRNGTYTDGTQTIEFTGDLSSYFTPTDILTIYDSSTYLIINSTSVVSASTYNTGGTTSILLVSALGGDYNVTVVNNTTSNLIQEDASHAEGKYTIASGQYSHAEGIETTASGYYSHAEGYQTTASGLMSHAEGMWTKATGDQSHAEGGQSTATGEQSHAEGLDTKAIAGLSHSEGEKTQAGWMSYYVNSSIGGLISITSDVDLSSEFTSGRLLAYGNTGPQKAFDYSSIGYSGTTFTVQLVDTTYNDAIFVSDINNTNSQNATQNLGDEAHAEGSYTFAFGKASHAQGFDSLAIGNYSHAGGARTEANGSSAFVHSYHSNVNSDYGVILGGQYNTLTDTASGSTITSSSGVTGTQSYTLYTDNLVVNKTKTPTTSGDTSGVIGQIAWDNSYAYIKTNTGWGRIALDYLF